MNRPPRPTALPIAASLLAALLLAGCEVGPNFQPPAAPDGAGYTPEKPADPMATADVKSGAAQRFALGKDIEGEWWTLFHSEALDRLVQRALQANPNVDAAQAALRQAKENAYAGEGALFPTVGASFQPERTRISGAELGEPRLSETFSLVTAQLNVSYAVDVFGGTRRQIESLKAQADYQRFELEATYLTLTSNVVAAAVNEASLRGQIAATEQIIKAEADQLGLVQKQFAIGSASRADLLTQQATLAQSRATLPPLRKQLAQQRNQLAALAGGFPSQELDADFDLANLQLPIDLPLSLPSQLVEQRPDVRAAQAQFHAASANLGVAIANQLPQFSITGSVGTQGLGFSNLFTPISGVWSIAGGITQTLFDAGTLLHKKRAAAAGLEQAAAQYRGTVITAFQNVADALRALQFDADTLHEQAAAEQAASDSLALARVQYQAGALSYLNLLNADRTWQQARVALVQAEAARFSDTAALFQALGGGWWHRSDVAADANGPAHLTPPLAAALQP
jgi:NodT family efflux transporter outer membrane factor (OMF) lipoprotein